MGINKRVVQLIESTTSSKSAFSTATGISTVILSHISSGRNKVSLTAVEQILKAFPNVNADWLILGKGAMLKDSVSSSITSQLQEDISSIELDILNF
ncbi:MAG: hypothetical protein ACPGYY_09545, partial [Bacteroidia bacterium]